MDQTRYNEFLSFSFHYPLLLVLLVVPILLLAWVWRGRRFRVVAPFDQSPARHRVGLQLILNLAASVPALLLAVTILILAGPQQLAEPKSKRVLTNIEFCVDISGSMTARFGEGTRYDASMAAINEFLDYREGDAFGLTFFGNSVLHWVPLTSDTSAVRCAPPFMRPEVAPPWFGGTEIGKALLACRKMLVSREEGDRMIILVSDGMSSDLSNGNDQEIAKKLRQDGIILYAIHIAGGKIPDEVVNMTALTGGEVFQPGDPDALAAVFKRIDSMQETKLEKTSAEAMDDFFGYSVIGLGLAGLLSLCSFGLRYTPW